MKFNDKFPDKVNPQKVYPERLMGPHPKIEVEPGLIQSWRIYPCTCGAPTGWRNVLADDFPPAPCCSEECRLQQKADHAEAENPQPEVNPQSEADVCPHGYSRTSAMDSDEHWKMYGGPSQDCKPPESEPENKSTDPA